MNSEQNNTNKELVRELTITQLKEIAQQAREKLAEMKRIEQEIQNLLASVK